MVINVGNKVLTILATPMAVVIFLSLFLITISILIYQVIRNKVEIKRINNDLESALKEARDARQAKEKTLVEEKENEEVIQRLSIFQRTILDNAGSAIISGKIDGTIASFNLAAERMLGYTADEMVGKLTPAVFHDKDEIIKRAEEFSKELNQYIVPGFDVFMVKARKNLPNVYEWTYIRKDGSRFPVLLTVSVLRDLNNNIIGYLGIATDITVRKEAEIKIMQAMNVKSEFTSMVSHELRTPLAVIKESIAIVYDETAGPINAGQKDFLETAKRNVDRLGRLINDVLDYQKLESPSMEFNMVEQSLNDVVKEVGDGFNIVVRNKKIDLQLHLQAGLPKVKFDKDKIIQVLTNLINNAMKFTSHGTISLDTEMHEQNAIKVSVKDEGIGIKSEDLDKLFKSFSQLSTGAGRQTGGTGLGLALCKKIIEQHNGKVGVESVFGQGSTFYFLLPI